MTGFTGIVTLLALAFYVYTGIVVAQARAKYGVKAPAITGAPGFERTFRVQMNTLEWLVPFLVSMWMFAAVWPEWIAALIGLVWIGGRFLYMQGYIADPAARSRGFLIQGIAVIVLFVGALAGLIWQMVGGPGA